MARDTVIMSPSTCAPSTMPAVASLAGVLLPVARMHVLAIHGLLLHWFVIHTLPAGSWQARSIQCASVLQMPRCYPQATLARSLQPLLSVQTSASVQLTNSCVSSLFYHEPVRMSPKWGCSFGASWPWPTPFLHMGIIHVMKGCGVGLLECMACLDTPSDLRISLRRFAASPLPRNRVAIALWLAWQNEALHPCDCVTALVTPGRVRNSYSSVIRRKRVSFWAQMLLSELMGPE